MSSMSTAPESGNHVAGLASQLQKLCSPGSSPAAFTSPLSLYVALAMALRGAGAYPLTNKPHPTVFGQDSVYLHMHVPCKQLPSQLIFFFHQL